MSLARDLENDLKNAMLAKNKELVDLLRLVKAALKNEMINLKKQELSDEDVFRVLKREAKKRNDSIQHFTKGGRQDLVDKEQKELDIIKKYLPEEMNQSAIQQTIDQVVSEMGQVAPSQFGLVMAQVMKKIQGQADGALVSQLVKQALNKQDSE